MTPEQIAATILIGATLALFAWGRWRFDVVALVALLTGVLIGLVPAEEAFAGFSHPAVITVAAVLIVSRAVALSGAIDSVAGLLAPAGGPVWVQIGGLCLLAAVLSAFMNNVGALALLMPVALSAAEKTERSPALLLMPLAFASMLGGLCTLIGTPPNVIIATYRDTIAATPFRMFDFAPVGVGVALAGVAFVALVGWRLIPQRVGPRKGELFGIDEYLTEARLKEESKAAGKSFRETEALLGDADARIVSVVRGASTIPSSAWWERLRAGDVLVMEVAPADIQTVLDRLGAELEVEPASVDKRLQTDELRLVEAVLPPHALLVGLTAELVVEPASVDKRLQTDELRLVEAVLPPHALLVGLTAEEVRLRHRYGVNLLAVARQGRPHRGRLKAFRFAAGDVLLLQGAAPHLTEAMSTLGAVPLAERDVRVGRPRGAGLTVGLAALAIVAAAVGLLPIVISLPLAAVAIVLTGGLRIDEAYDAIDWPVIILLAALIPVGGVLETTGLTRLISEVALANGAKLGPVVLLAAVLVLTMTLSDIVNNAATAVMMAPLAAQIAVGLGVSPDPFLMAVAVGASCAFLTPIGHQNNTLVMGPGGYRFWDYWRMGLPLEVVVVATAVPLILLVWPL